DEGIIIARSAVAAVAADGLVVIEEATGDGRGSADTDRASRAISDEAPGSAVASDGPIVTEGAVAECGRGREEVNSAAGAVGETAVVGCLGKIFTECSVAESGRARQDVDAASETVPGRRGAAHRLVVADGAVGDDQRAIQAPQASARAATAGTAEGHI